MAAARCRDPPPLRDRRRPGGIVRFRAEGTAAAAAGPATAPALAIGHAERCLSVLLLHGLLDFVAHLVILLRCSRPARSSRRASPASRRMRTRRSRVVRRGSDRKSVV